MAAGDIDLSTFTPIISGGADTIWNIIIYGGIILLVTGICWFIFWWTSYNIHYRIREMTGDKTRIIDDKAKRIKGKDGVIKWKLRTRRDFVPIPKSEAIHLTRKGKMSVEAYYTPFHEYKYIDDQGVEQTEIKKKDYQYLVDKGISADVVSSFKALNTADREFYANEFREATTYLKKHWTDYILPVAGIIALLIIMVCMFAFWEDITKPTLEAQKTNVEVTKIQVEMLQQIKEIMRHAQIVTDYNGTVPVAPQVVK